MHRHIEIGLGVILGLVVVNSAQAAPRDGRFVLKGHGTAAAAERLRRACGPNLWGSTTRFHRGPSVRQRGAGLRLWSGKRLGLWARPSIRLHGRPCLRLRGASRLRRGTSLRLCIGSWRWVCTGGDLWLRRGARLRLRGSTKRWLRNGESQWLHRGVPFRLRGRTRRVRNGQSLWLPRGARLRIRGTSGSAYSEGAGYPGEPGNGYAAVPSGGYVAAGQTPRPATATPARRVVAPQRALSTVTSRTQPTTAPIHGTQPLATTPFFIPGRRPTSPARGLFRSPPSPRRAAEVFSDLG